MTRSVQRGARGFTLLELMVAVLVGSIVVMGIYTLYGVSVRGYRVQDQTLEALGNLRMAGQQLKADLRSAAFNAPAQSNAEAWVQNFAGAVLTGIAIDVDPNAPVANPGDNVNIAPQRIRLLGDFESQNIYTTVNIAGALVTLNWPPAGANPTQAEFDRMFSANNMLRIEMYGQARQEQVIPILSSNFNGGVNPQVTLTAPVQGMMGFGSGHEVSVITYVRYRIQQDTRRGGATSVKYDLIRERLDPTGAPIPGTWLIVAEYAVDLGVYDLCFNVSAPQVGTMQQLPVQLQCFEDVADMLANGFSLAPGPANQSHLLRSVKFKLSMRTPFEDPELLFVARTDVNAPLQTFDLDTNLEGSARVFETATGVFLTSIQARRQ